MKSKNKKPEYDLIGCMRLPKHKKSLFRIILNKLLPSQGNVGKVTDVYFWEKADSPRNFSGKILKLVGILLWIIVLLNLIITFLIYKIIF